MLFDYLPPNSLGIVLPTPEVGVVKNGTITCPDNGIALTADGANSPLWLTFPAIRAANVVDALLNTDLDLRLELLWYKAQGRRLKSGFGYRDVVSGFKHPADKDASTNHIGADTHYGSQVNVAEARTSEWPITTRNQIVPVNLSGYLRNQLVPYRDNAGGVSSVNALVPAWIKGTRGPNGSFNLKRINSRLVPLFISFRYSIRDMVKEKGRIYGPMSPVLAISHEYAPIARDISYEYANAGLKGYSLNPSFDISRMKVNFARRNKL